MKKKIFCVFMSIGLLFMTGCLGEEITRCGQACDRSGGMCKYNREQGCICINSKLCDVNVTHGDMK
jgi:hypothetical protein